MRDVLEDLVGWWQAGETVGMGTVVATGRSAPRPAGASMLGGPDGRTLYVVAAPWLGFENMFDGPPEGQVLTVRAPAAVLTASPIRLLAMSSDWMVLLSPRL